ncbi:titin [Manduca sexta]|uniref:titin n=1 Tax=Manduca sexta TaxID=7130 RepID=UPI00188F4A0A|nr:titin [Manduca sexta]XP_030021222.2 titin [Manduca sexta]
MVRGAALALTLALAWACSAQASVLVPTYVLPPDSFVRDQRSLGASDTDAAESTRTIKRLVGGHLKIKPDKEFSSSKNAISFDQKGESGKFAGVIAPDQSGGNVGWNQGIWDDGMLMSSAGEGKDGPKTKEDDEDKKTLSDQVAEGKYGLIQNEIFSKTPKRPGIVSYEPNAETRAKDNLQSLGGLKKDEIWLAEDHLLVLKGGSFPERTKETERRPWPPIDDYEAPNRQVKLPQKPKVPPPFPVRLSDDGPLVFLTPNGSVPASLFPPFFTRESEGFLSSPPFPFPPGETYPPSDYKGNSTSGGAPQPGPPFPFLPGNASEGAFPFPPSMNGSLPEGYPPGAAFLPPPSNQSDLYDEDDPSIYYPPPYNFSYRADYNNKVPAGPLVPGIVLPPPPDFFAPLEEKTTTETIKTTTRPTTYTRQKTTTKPVPTHTVHRTKYKTRPTTTESVRTTEVPTTFTTPPPVEIVTTPKQRKPQRVPTRHPVRVHNLPDEINTRPKTEKPVYKSRTKLTSKPLSVSVIYDYPEPVYDARPPATSEKPFVVYVPQKTHPNVANDVTSTAVPLRAFYSNTQNDVPTTKLQPVYNRKPSDNALASFYFFDEQPKTSPSPATFFDGRNYYKTVPVNPQHYSPQQVNTQAQYSPAVDVTYGAIDQADDFFLWPQKQGPRTLTQEYFSIQKPKPQPVFVQQPKQRPDFYQQIADIQQTIDYYTTKRPKVHSHRQHTHKPKVITSRPVYQLNYQSNHRPELPFRAPKLDPEPFRPMVSYSKPFNLEDFNAITPSASPGYHQQYLIENVPVTTETPSSTKYYPKSKTRDDDYEDVIVERDVRTQSNRNNIIQNDKPAAVVSHHVTRYPSTTPSPISHGYYTKQDERYFDDITRNSFDIFGKKLEDSTHDIHGLAVTAPLETVKTPVDNNINLQYAYDIVDTQSPSPNPPSLEHDTLVNDRHPRPPINPDSEPFRQNAAVVQENPPSLADDTLVNDRLPRPTINPDSEFIPIANPHYRNAHYRVAAPQYTGEQDDLNQPPPPSLEGDTEVNYKRPLPTPNPDAEWIGPAAGEGRPGSLVSYRLPGEDAHVYFLTPAATRERYRAPDYNR